MENNNKINVLELIDFVRKLNKITINNDDQLSFYQRLFFIAFIAGSYLNKTQQMKSIYKAKYVLKSIDMEIQRKSYTFEDLNELLNVYVVQGNNINDFISDDMLFDLGDEKVVSLILKETESNENVEQMKNQKNKVIQEQQKQQSQIQEKQKFSIKALQEKAKQLSELQTYDQSLVEEQQKSIIQLEKISNLSDKQLEELALKQSQIVKNSLKEQFHQVQEEQLQNSQLYSVIIKQEKQFKKQDCKICFSTLDEEFQISNCLHTFHKNCLKQYVNSQTILPIKCPMELCKEELNILQLQQLCDQQKLDVLSEASFNKFINQNPQIFQCPTPNCKGIYEVVGPSQFCLLCSKVFCTKCKKISHQGICGEASFIQLANRQKFKQCSQCKRWIEKNQGCIHITCTCGYQFCYECGGRWQQDHICRDQNQNQNQNQQIIRENVREPFIRFFQLNPPNRNEQHIHQQRRNGNSHNHQSNYMKRLETQLKNLGINFIFNAI